MKRLRILYLVNDLRAHGGAEVALANLVTHLDRNRFEIWVGGIFGKGLLEERLRLPRGHVVSFGFRRRFYADIKGLLRLVHFLKQKQIQVIHTHLFAANTVGRVAAQLARVPIVVATEHNTYLAKPRWCIWVDCLLAGVTTQMIAVSETVRAFAADQAGISRDQFVVIPNGIPLEQIPQLSPRERLAKRVSLEIEADQPVILSVGRLTEQKGYLTLLQAAELVAREYPETLFLIVGTGILENVLRKRIARLRLDKHVRLLGFRCDVYELMQISTLLAMPSLWEGLPVTCIEAGACRLPVVASRVGGIPEVVQDGKSGLLVPPKDEVAFAREIIRLIRSPDLCRQMGDHGRHVIEERFDVVSVARRTEDLYLSLCRRELD